VKPFSVKQHYLVLAVLTLVTVAVRLPFRGPYLFDGDPVGYYLGARSLLESGQYLMAGKIPFWPIGTSLTMVPFIWVLEQLGLAPESAGFWQGVVFMVAAVSFIYLLGKRLFNPATGILAALLFSFAESPFFYSINAASDIGAIAALCGGTYFLLRFLDTQDPLPLFLAFFLCAFSLVFRWNYVFFIPLFWIFLIGDRRIWAFSLYPSFWLLLGSGILSGLLIQFWANYTHYHTPFLIRYWELGFSKQFVLNPVKLLANLGRIVYRVLLTWDFYSPLLAAFGLLAVALAYHERRRDLLMLLLPWIVLGSLSIVYFAVKPRLLIPLMPPFFMLGAAGLTKTFLKMREELVKRHFSPTPVLAGIFLMGGLLFLPMVARSLLNAYGRYQDKVTMRRTFEWVGKKAADGDYIITQPPYAGRDVGWQQAGWTLWASNYYSGLPTLSLAQPESWREPEHAWLVVNDFWFQAENMQWADTELLRQRSDSLRTAWNLTEQKVFKGRPAPLWLKKLNMLSFYPLDFMRYRPLFRVYHRREDPLRSGARID